MKDQNTSQSGIKLVKNNLPAFASKTDFISLYIDFLKAFNCVMLKFYWKK